MIHVTGPNFVSSSASPGPVCVVVQGATGPIQADLLSAPTGIRLRKSGGKPNEFCLIIPPGVTGVVEIRFGDGQQVTRTAILVSP